MSTDTTQPNATTAATQDAELAKRAFLADMRHDLRTPINAIIGYSEMLLEDLADEGDDADGDVVADLEQVHAAAKELDSLVGAILDQTAIDAESEVDLGAYGRRIREGLRESTELALERTESLLARASTDDPLGSLSDLGRIRDAAAKRLKLADSTSSLWRARVDEAAPEPELAEAPPTDADEETAPRTLLADVDVLADSARGGAVLITDGDATSRLLAAEGLRREGHHVTMAGSGQEALALAREGCYEVILLGTTLPDMDGRQALARLKADENLRSLPVLMRSTAEETAILCLEEGADDYVAKPINPVLLRARVKAALERKRLRQELHEAAASPDWLAHVVVRGLREPLTSIKAEVQLIDALGDLTDDQRDVVDMALEGSRALLGTVNDLLDLSGVGQGGMTLDYEQVRVSDLVGETLHRLDATARLKAVELSSYVSADARTIAADKAKLGRGLETLIRRAVKATPSGGEVRVSARTQRGEQTVAFSVTEAGEHSPEEVPDRPARPVGAPDRPAAELELAARLGVTLCRMVVECHGGHFRVQDEPGRAGTCSFTVPMERAPR